MSAQVKIVATDGLNEDQKVPGGNATHYTI